MSGRVIELTSLAQARAELAAVGSQPAGVDLMAPKAIFRAVKLKNIRSVAANIIKQEMLSYGGEAATAYGAVNLSLAKTDLLILGTLKQFSQLIAKLKQHEFGLPEIAQEINQLLNNYQLVHRPLGLGARTLLMGVLNVTPDSFSDGGEYLGLEAALSQARRMLADGADIIDIGGESSRPGAQAVSAEEEIRRVIPVIERLAKETKAFISIDTAKARVAEAAVKAGAKMVNDISGLRFDPEMAGTIARAGAAVCVMHIKGQPQNMQENPSYDDLIAEILDYLSTGLAIAKKTGILASQIIIDPGIGFGKTRGHNLEILRRLREFKVLGCPILVGPSRKSFIGQTLGLPVADRLEGTAASVTAAILNGADIIRAHDVKAMARVAKMADAIIMEGKG